MARARSSQRPGASGEAQGSPFWNKGKRAFFNMTIQETSFGDHRRRRRSLRQRVGRKRRASLGETCLVTLDANHSDKTLSSRLVPKLEKNSFEAASNVCIFFFFMVFFDDQLFHVIHVLHDQYI